MIITCPECAARYDLDDDRFLPNGRSVRCTNCGESWFVPAPEPIEALGAPILAPAPEERIEPAPEAKDPEPVVDKAPIEAEAPVFDVAEDIAPMRANDSLEAEVTIVAPPKEALPPRDEKGRFIARKKREAQADAAQFDDDGDDELFAPKPAPASLDEAVVEREAQQRSADPDPSLKATAEPRTEAREEKASAPEEVRPYFAKHFAKNKKNADAPRRAARSAPEEPKAAREKPRPAEKEEIRTDRAARDQKPNERRTGPAEFRRSEPKHEPRADMRSDRERDYHARRRESYAPRDYERDFDERAYGDRVYDERIYDQRDDEYRAYDRYEDARYDEDDYIPGEATIVDADFEDVEDGMGPRFGRRLREERRRATALARLEDVRRFEPQALDEEFFRSLRVTPRELEKAVRKARRRAEARDKNRMTPWRAFGWSAWVAAVAAAAYAVVTYRDEIVKAAPSAADAYAVVGIETDSFGLKIEDVRHRLAMSTAGPMIEISGALKNRGSDALDAPLLQAEALGPRGELLARWTFSPEEKTVLGGGAVTFTTRNAAPEGVSEVALSFAPDRSAASN